MNGQISMFDGKNKFKIEKPIRLIELFAGYGSQHLALKYLDAKVESYRICEWAVKSIQAYKDLHQAEDNTDYSANLSVNNLIDYLASKGISSNYNEPMTYDQVKRMGESKIRQCYNNIQATHNLVNIMQAKGCDLAITDTDKYTYIMTYSFPCQDLSSAGLGKGMTKDSGTRSGLLWEVERLLTELNGNLPQVLVMENVPEVHGTNNIKDFAKWIAFLDSLGYKSKWQDLNAKDYGIPQNRERCFMVSVLGDYYYEFPKAKLLNMCLDDMLEKEVDKKYFLDSIPLKKELCDILIKNGLVEEGDVIRHSYTHNRLDNGVENMSRTESKDKLCPTLDTRCDTLGVCVKFHKPIIYDDYNHRIKADQSAINTLTTNCGNEAKGNGVKIIYPDLTIRKLTPKECFRLMGVKDMDFDKVAANQSNQSLYHLAGDSIVANVLMAIFGEML